jgi:glycine N-methyltransferase
MTILQANIILNKIYTEYTATMWRVAVIEEGNWLTLVDDVAQFNEQQMFQFPGKRFDAVICLGNSFAHLPDFEGNLANQRRAISNFVDLVKPGGILVIDHRNYDEIIRSGAVPANNVYYNVSRRVSHHISARLTLFAT